MLAMTETLGMAATQRRTSPIGSETWASTAVVMDMSENANLVRAMAHLQLLVARRLGILWLQGVHTLMHPAIPSHLHTLIHRTQIRVLTRPICGQQNSEAVHRRTLLLATLLIHCPGQLHHTLARPLLTLVRPRPMPLAVQVVVRLQVQSTREAIF